MQQKSTGETFIIDAKWKIIKFNNPSDSDLKQMFAYNLYWNAGKSVLLYPSNSVIVEDYGKFHKGRNGDNKCKLGFVKVIDENGRLERKIGEKFIEKLALVDKYS